MKAIGGYFELELNKSEHYHKNALKLNTARNCFEYVLKARQYKKVYIPYYTCEVMLEPLDKLNVDHEFYHVDQQLDPVFDKAIHEDEAFLYTNYFGLKQKTVIALSEKIDNLIIDNAQAFFAKPVDGIDTFYSARKFFGVPDGAYLYTSCYLDQELDQDVSFGRMGHLLKRYERGPESAYADFCKVEDSLKNLPVRKMSKLTGGILQSLDYGSLIVSRRCNYNQFAFYLNKSNQVHFDLGEDDVPMTYPYLVNSENLKNDLILSKIYVATYWSNVLKWCDESSIECSFVKYLLPLPVDQRYGEIEMECILKLIMNYGV